jgi:hypothetical protein
LSGTGVTSLIETGDWQTVLTFSTVNAAGAPVDDWTVQFRSDSVEAPLPTALPLFATGIGALGLIGWRRKQKSASSKF